MNLITKTAAAALLLSLSVPQISAADFGYCTDVAARSNIFRMGSTEKQGLAIRLTPEKIASLQGNTITSISTTVGSSRTDGGKITIFIAETLDGDPIMSQDVDVKGAVKWLNFVLDNPYTITGQEKDLYIGYTASISTKSSMLMADYTEDVAECTFVYNNGQWIDMYGLGFGAPSIRFGIDGAKQYADLLLKPIAVDGYFVADKVYSQQGQVFNFGTEVIKTFDINVKVGDSDPVKIQYTGAEIAQGCVADFILPDFGSPTEGEMAINVEISNINGSADDEASDNSFSTDMYFYPKDMERSILIEGFTGQECTNCPAGHQTLEEFLESAGDIPAIEVMHHAGYKPDFMTMDADMDYTFFYGGTSTYAPAVMLNRSVIPGVGSVPVMGVTKENLSAAYKYLSSTKPYVSLGLDTEYDPATRMLKVDVRTFTHADMPAEYNVLNIMLVQDGVVSMQIPYGANYEHNGVFRGVITGNAWGLLLSPSATEAGGTTTWSTTVEIPEYIFSDYYDQSSMSDEMKLLYSTPSVIDNMYLVAYVASYSDSSVSGHTVYNAVSVPLGQSYNQGGMSGIKNVAADKHDLSLSLIGRRIVVNGEFDTLSVYTVAGQAVNASEALNPGIYVARVTKGADIITKKIIIR